MFKIIEGGITAPQGYLAGGVIANIRKQDKKDVAVVYSEVIARAAACYTTNQFKAAPIEITMNNLADGNLQAVVINSGIANACMGEQGLKDARQMAEITADSLSIAQENVAVASTGVIGMPLPMDRIEQGIRAAVKSIRASGGQSAAEAIMTTDLVKKEIACQIEIDGLPVTIGAMAKGSGMIHPNMATMLAFITTDAAIEQDCLQEILKECTASTFNMISVDGDTSTNDMLLIMANGLAGNKTINAQKAEFEVFKDAILTVCTMLAKMIAADGEGATKLIEVEVRGALSLEDARLAARAICSSNLVKAAVFGEDANWGRIITALGYSKAKVDPFLVDVYLGELLMAKSGSGQDFDEVCARSILSEREIKIVVDLNLGIFKACSWGCDLSYDYIKINAAYRT